MPQNRSIPASTVIPELAYPDIGEAMAWLCSAFGFTLRLQIGSHRAQINVGDGAVVLTEWRREGHRDAELAHSVMVRVDDVDRHYERAGQHGALVIRPPTECPCGEGQYTVEDLVGHRWTFSQSIADVDPMDWGGTPGRL